MPRRNRRVIFDAAEIRYTIGGGFRAVSGLDPASPLPVSLNERDAARNRRETRRKRKEQKHAR